VCNERKNEENGRGRREDVLSPRPFLYPEKIEKNSNCPNPNPKLQKENGDPPKTREAKKRGSSRDNT
jgi:hypothetical protein